MRPFLENAELTRPMFLTGIKSRVMKTTIADNFQITKEMPLFMWLDPNGGNKDVRLPLATDTEHAGLMYFIINDADDTETITVKNAGETETVVSIGQGNIAIVFNDGASVTGWVGAVFDQTVAGTLTSLTTTGDGVIGGGDLDLGSSGTAGTLDIFPTTASSGKFTLSVADQTGNTAFTLRPSAHGQATTLAVADYGLSTAYVMQGNAAQAASGALLFGSGTSAAKDALGTTAGNALSFYFDATHTTGDMRGQYLRLDFSGTGGSGEAFRAFSIINDKTVATGGTVNGAHISLGTAGASAGVSGAANALRCTFGIAALSTAIGGTCSVIQVDTDFASGVTAPSNFAFLRFTNTNTVKSNNLLRIPNVAAETGGLFCAHTTEAMSHSIKIVSEDGTAYYIMCTNATTHRTES
jgi:hypothetical protein